jgi:hypothetical protein
MESSEYGRIIAMVAQKSPQSLGPLLAALGQQQQTRGMSPEVGGMFGGQETGEAPEKILGNLLPILAQHGPSVVNAALPHILRLFGRRKGFEAGGAEWGGFGGGVEGEAPEKFIGAILPVLAQYGPTVIGTALPHILRAFGRRKGFEAGGIGGGMGGIGGEEVGAEKAFNLWRTIRNVAPQAARYVLPIVMNALRKEYTGGDVEGTKGFEGFGAGAEELNTEKAFNLWRTIRNVAPQAARYVLPIVMNALRKDYTAGAETEGFMGAVSPTVTTGLSGNGFQA